MCKVIKNRFIPFKGFRAINLFGLIFVRKEYSISERLINHERIHTKQMLELFIFPFYVWYMFEWMVRGCLSGFDTAYRNICFEREAYKNDHDIAYLKHRQAFNFLKYL